MNALDLLLTNKVNMDRPTRSVKIARLSTEDMEFSLTAVAMTMEDFRHLQETNTKNGVLDDVGMNLMMVTYGIREFDARIPENKDRINEIKKNYNVSNMMKFVNQIFLPGEIAKLVMEITDVSGFNEDLLDNVKKK